MAKKIEIATHNKLAVTPDEAAALISSGTGTIREMMQAKILPYMMLGSGYKIWISDLLKLSEKLKYKQWCTKKKELVDIDYIVEKEKEVEEC